MILIINDFEQRLRKLKFSVLCCHGKAVIVKCYVSVFLPLLSSMPSACAVLCCHLWPV